MTRLANLDRSAHQGLRVLEDRAFAACSVASTCLVIINEIPRLVAEYPVAFTKNSVTGDFVCVALFGAVPGQNVFWRDGRWDSYFVPLNVARQPFSVGVAENPAAASRQKNSSLASTSTTTRCRAMRARRCSKAMANTHLILRHKMKLLAELVDGEQRTRQFAGKAYRTRTHSSDPARAEGFRSAIAQDHRPVFDRRTEIARPRSGHHCGTQ